MKMKILPALSSLLLSAVSVLASDAILIKGGSLVESKELSGIVLTKASLLITIDGNNVSYYADKIVYKQNERTIELSGNVVLKTPSFEARSEKLTISLTDWNAKVFVQNSAGIDTPSK